MALGMMTAVIDAISLGYEGGTPAALTMAGLDPRSPDRIYKIPGGDFEERALQYWPETISDTIEIGWNFKDIPGGSSALASWASNGGRTISFDIQLSRLMAPLKRHPRPYELTTKEKVALVGNLDPSDDPSQRKYNVNIVEYIKFLRGFCYPSYFDVAGVVSAVPPPIAIINIPNMALNEDGSDSIYAVMTGCDVNYMLAFIDGTPRRASVSVTFRQIVQTKAGIRVAGFGYDAPIKYNNETSYNSEKLDRSAGRLD